MSLSKEEALKDVKLFVLDMDGTFYLGDRIIDGALDLIHQVEDTGRESTCFSPITPPVFLLSINRN